MLPLTIELETRELRVGDVVRGRVRVEEDFPQAEGIDLRLRYTVRGTPHTLVEQRLVSGPVHAGREVPFEVSLVEGPYSWEMPNVSVGWHVQAAVAIAWRIDPKATAELVVRPREVPPDEAVLERLTTEAEAVKKTNELGPVGGAIVWSLVALFALALFPFLPIALILWARSAVTKTRVRDLELVLPGRRVAHGEWFPVIVRFTARRPFRLEQLALTFSGSERWTTGSGDNRRSRREVFFTERQTLLEGRVVALGAEEARGGGGGAYRGRGRPRFQKSGPLFEWHTGFRLPPDGPPSAASGLTYDLELDLDIDALPDLTVRKRLATLGARVQPLPPAGDPPPPEQTSGALTFLREGDPVPPGVDARVRAGGLMRWVLLSFLGVALGVGGLVGLAIGAALAAIPLALGGLLLALAVGAFLWALYR